MWYVELLLPGKSHFYLDSAVLNNSIKGMANICHHPSTHTLKRSSWGVKWTKICFIASKTQLCQFNSCPCWTLHSCLHIFLFLSFTLNWFQLNSHSISLISGLNFYAALLNICTPGLDLWCTKSVFESFSVFMSLNIAKHNWSQSWSRIHYLSTGRQRPPQTEHKQCR